MNCCIFSLPFGTKSKYCFLVLISKLESRYLNALSNKSSDPSGEMFDKIKVSFALVIATYTIRSSSSS